MIHGQQNLKKWFWIVAGLLVAVYARSMLWQTLTQLLYGVTVALMALPLMRYLEKRFPPALAASLSLIGLGGVALAFGLLLMPPLVRQTRQMLVLLPGLWDQLSGWVQQGEVWLGQNGLPVNGAFRVQLATWGETWLSKAAPAMLSWIKHTIGGMSRWMLAPVLGFYFLKDRRQLGEWLLLLIPVEKRQMSVRLQREICRETAGYLRGQLMISLAVGGLTSVGLLLCGIPAWLPLGAVMGGMELIPFVGPLIGGAVVLLFSLQAGTGRMLWALAVVLMVQQLEGSWLSPRLMSDATRIHPVAVLLCMTAGGTVGGIWGMLLAVPTLLCLRAMMHICILGRRMHPFEPSDSVKER